MRMAYYPSDFIGQELRYSCRKCQRSGSMPASDALARYGNKPMPDLRYDFAIEFGCHRGPDAQFNDKCQLSYDRSGEEMLGIAPAPQKPDHERAPFAMSIENHSGAPGANKHVSIRLWKMVDMAPFAGERDRARV